MKKVLFYSLITLFFAVLNPSPVFSQQRTEELNHGYALLHRITSECKNMSLIFIIKNGSPEVHALTTDVDKIMSRIDSQLNRWANEDSTLDLNHTGLPEVETRARKFADSSTKKILMNSSGARFDQMLKIVDYESVGYTLNLVNALSQVERNPERRKVLKSWASSLEALQKRIVKAML